MHGDEERVVRDRLHIDVYEVDDTGVVHPRG